MVKNGKDIILGVLLVSLKNSFLSVVEIFIAQTKTGVN